MTIRTVPWQRRVPTLVLATVLDAAIIVVLLRGLTLPGQAPRETPLLVNIVRPPPRPAPQAPKLPEPKLAQAPPIPPLIASVVTLPKEVTTPAPKVAATPTLRVRPPVPSSTSGSGEVGPKLISGPLDADEYYPMAARVTFSQGQVWTRVCVYSTGEVASVALLRTSGDRLLDQAALTVARQTRWKPAVAHGEPVARCTPFRVDFSLTHGPLVLGGFGGIR